MPLRRSSGACDPLARSHVARANKSRTQTGCPRPAPAEDGSAAGFVFAVAELIAAGRVNGSAADSPVPSCSFRRNSMAAGRVNGSAADAPVPSCSVRRNSIAPG